MQGMFLENVVAERLGEQKYVLSLKAFGLKDSVEIVAKDEKSGNQLFVMTDQEPEETRKKLIQWINEIEIIQY
jgi:hypothetical protein